MMYKLLWLIFVMYILLANTPNSFGGVMHSSSSDLHKERESDGSYSPKDKSHYDEAGEHHSEFDHEAILGSYKEAEEFDHLPPEESKRRLGLLLKKMDLNGDEFISRKELKAWILRSFKALSEEEANERFEDADEDNNGVVTWKEYLTDAYGSDDENPLNINDENDHLIADDKAMWKAADTNNDGVLDKNEWIAFSHPEEHPMMLPIILEQTLRDKDKDNDKAISFQEFLGEREQEQHDREWLKIEKEKFDHDFDKDKDGKLVGSEILSWVVPSNEEIADEEVIHLFAASDDDHDDVLSFEEVINHHDTFVGSEATDYGDHLHNIHRLDDEL